MKLGKYEILKELGHGGFGVVYKARDLLLGRDVALKVLHPALAIDGEFVARFRKEAQFLASLDHPNIVPVYDFGEADGRYYICMRYLPGGDLAGRIKQGDKLSPQEVHSIIGKVINGLSYAHARGLIHRDIKPANILFAHDGEPVITDFGLAKSLHISTSSTSLLAGTGVGTPYYKAPELWRGQAATTAVDQYSLACVIVEMLSGKVLFWGDTTPAVLMKHFEPIELPPELPADSAAVLMRALEKEPSLRYPNLTDFYRDFEEAVFHPAETKLPLDNNSQNLARTTQKTTLAKLPWVLVVMLAALAGVFILTSGDKFTKNAQPTQNLQPSAQASTLAISAFSAPETQVPIAPTAAPQVAALKPTQGIQPVQPTPTLTTPSPTLTAVPTATEAAQQSAGVRSKDQAPMVFVPAGKFLMGHNAGFDDEIPAHTVDLDGFWIDKYEVTNQQYALCVEAGVCDLPYYLGSFLHTGYYDNPAFVNYPVIYVSWYDAVQYCQWAGARLPTEAEWEKAARGEDGRIYPWGNASPTGALVNFNQKPGDTTAVGQYPDGASPYGALDMAGNVWEWVEDWYSASYYQLMPGANPRGPISGTLKVVRGGSWVNDADIIRSTNRGYPVPEYTSHNYGFRCAVTNLP